MKDVDRLGLEEKVGQLFFLGFHGYEPDRSTRALLENIRPGGIIVSRRNIETFEQTTRLTGRLVESRDIPTIVAIAQEGGATDSLRHLYAPIPSPSEVARSGMPRLRLFSRIIGEELLAAGFNTLLGPTLDLSAPGSVLSERTLAASPSAVTRVGTAFLEEIGRSGIIPCGKHFPGLGAAERDPHFTLPRIDKPKKLLLMEDIPPFVNLFPMLPMMMVGHAYFPTLVDSRPLPACLSPRIVERLLRKKLGYSGVILTDDLTKGAITSLGLTPERFLEALEAGNDMLLFSQTTPLVEQAFQVIVRSARRSTTLSNRITTSVRRILALKRQIQPPVRNRANMRTRILRHIERLSREVEMAQENVVDFQTPRG